MPQATTLIPGTTGGNREDLRDDITMLEPQKTPYTSAVAKTAEAKAMLTEVLGDRMRAPRTNGTREGTAGGRGGNKAVKRARFGTYMHRAQDDWAVTLEQQLISRRGGTAGVSNEADWQRAKTLSEFKRDIEAVNMSTNDGQDGAGGDADMKTRGVMKWLSPSGTTLTPTVPNDFRVPGGTASGDAVDTGGSLSCVFTHGNTAPQLFTEDQFNKIGKNLGKIHGGKETFDCIAGDNVIETVDHFERLIARSTTESYTVPHFGGDATIQMMVNIYESSFWRVNMIGSQFVQCDSDGVGDANAAAILKMDLWQLDHLQELSEVETYDNAGGEGGTYLTLWLNECFSPRGNGKIIRA
jgi:hypothetical protein